MRPFLAVLLLAGAVGAGPVQRIKDFHAPHYDKKGVLEWEVRGDAEIDGDGNILIEGLRARIVGESEITIRGRQASLREGGGPIRVEGDVVLDVADGTTLHADYLVWTPSTERLESDGPVEISRGDLTITGTGFDGDVGLDTYRILSDVEGTVGPGTQKTEVGFQDGAGTVTVRSAGPMNYDRVLRKVSFSERAVAERLGRRVDADRISFDLDEEHRLQWVRAAGEVVLRQEGRLGRGETASWDVVDAVLVLEGSPATIAAGERLSGARRITLRDLDRRVLLEGDAFFQGPPRDAAAEETPKGA